MLPAIGSMIALNPTGRPSVVVATHALGEATTGRQLVALQLKTVDHRNAQGQSATRISGLAPPAVEAVEKAAVAHTPQPAQRPRVARTPDQLSSDEKTELARLRQRDAQVRQEETAHAALAGALAGPIEYVRQRGPDGRQYAVGGSVAIQAVAASGDPAELRQLGARLAAAALAPTNPSAQDRAAARLGLRVYAEAEAARPQTALFENNLVAGAAARARPAPGGSGGPDSARVDLLS